MVDQKTRKIHNPLHFVRDFYFFKRSDCSWPVYILCSHISLLSQPFICRSQYPQLCLVHKDTKVAHGELQEQAMSLKFVEIGKVMLVWGILKNVSQVATVSNKRLGLFMISSIFSPVQSKA